MGLGLGWSRKLEHRGRLVQGDRYICPTSSLQLPYHRYKVTAQLGEYDTFGENGFLHRSPSPVSVRSLTLTLTL